MKIPEIPVYSSPLYLHQRPAMLFMVIQPSLRHPVLPWAISHLVTSFGDTNYWATRSLFTTHKSLRHKVHIPSLRPNASGANVQKKPLRTNTPRRNAASSAIKALHHPLRHQTNFPSPRRTTCRILPLNQLNTSRNPTLATWMYLALINLMTRNMMPMLTLSSHKQLDFTSSHQKFLLLRDGMRGPQQSMCVNAVPHPVVSLISYQATWYHLQQTKIGDSLVVICMCPHQETRCVHDRFLSEHSREVFPTDAIFDQGKFNSSQWTL